MTKAKRGRGSRRGIYLCAAAALGVALSGCGGSTGNSAAAASAANGSAATGGSAPPQGSTAAQGTSTGSGTATGSAGSGSTGSGATTPQSTGSGSTATGSTGSSGGRSSTPSNSNITLNWLPPTENTDGTALTNLAGYNIHYGKASHRYTRKISVSNAGIAAYVVQDLTPGRYYFSVAAVNSHGTESPLSAEVTATVN